MNRLRRHLGPGLLTFTAGIVLLVLLLPIKFGLPLLAVLAVGWLLQVAAVWSEGRPRRRRAVFLGMLFAPVVVLGIEAGLAMWDWLAARSTSPLRASIEGLNVGMIERGDGAAYRLVPGRRYSLWGGTVAIDRNGFRSSYDVSLEKPPGVVRVMVTGGSSAFGWGVADGQDVAGRLAALLNTPGGPENRRFEVINAAVPYYTSFQELNAYERVLRKYRPDVLIVLDGRNDARYAITQGSRWRPASAGGIGDTPFDPPPARPESLSPAFVRLDGALLRSALYRRYNALYRRFDPPPRTDTAAMLADFNPAAIEQFRHHRERIADLAVQDGCLCILALQPVIHLGKPLTAAEREHARMWGDLGEVFRVVYPRFAAANGGPQNAGTVRLDLSELFSGFTGDAYLDECHYTAEGNRLIAERLAEVIRERTPAATIRPSSPAVLPPE
ncbi:MAG: SGNH/GDSL hydrolase family protein [Phycisphaerae bacterium]|jgi:lysophospholipase L1-like esterase